MARMPDYVISVTPVTPADSDDYTWSTADVCRTRGHGVPAARRGVRTRGAGCRVARKGASVERR